MTSEYEDDGAALNFLEKRGIVPNRGGILYFNGDWGRDNHLHQEEAAAIQYLVHEWGYAWEGLNWRPENSS